LLCHDAGFVSQNLTGQIDLLAYMLKYINLQVADILATNMLVKNVTIQNHN